MPIGRDLLTPIPGNNPSGANLRHSPIYSRIKEARRKEDPSAAIFDRPLKEAEYGLVIKLAADALENKTKDLWLAAWLAEALIYEDEFAGLTEGLNVLRGLVENFSDTVYPEAEDGDVEMRVPPLLWVAEHHDFKLAVHELPLTKGPLTKWGLDWFKYAESKAVGSEADCGDSTVKLAARAAAISEGKLTAEEFMQDADATPSSHYEALLVELEQSLAALDALDSACQEKFLEFAPRFEPLREVIAEEGRVARNLLGRRGRPEPQPEPQPDRAVEVTPEFSPERDAAAAAPPSQGPGPQAGESLSADPSSREDAIARIVRAAQYLRSDAPGDPMPYLVVRAVRWGELRAIGDASADGLLEAPPTEVRQRIKRHMLDGLWQEAIDAAEEAASAPYGRGWLDLQRYIVRACSELGGSHDRIRAAIRSELSALLELLPQLPEMTLMDDTPTANGETQAWLRELRQERNGSQTAALEKPIAWDSDSPGEASGGNGDGNAPVAAIDSFQLALKALGSGDRDGAMEILAQEIAQERSGRGRFLKRLQLAQICALSKRDTIARVILEEMAGEIESRKLEDWEAPETIAQALALLHKSLGRDDEEHKRKVYAQICRLDPVQAARLST